MTAPWPWIDRPRVLIEHPDPLAATAAAARLRRAGYAVAICYGPAPNQTCPLLKGGECPTAASADVVVSALGEAGLPITDALRLRYPRTPLAVPELLDVDEIVAEVREATAL